MASILTRTATAASKLQGMSKTNSATEDKSDHTASLMRATDKASPARSSSPDSLSQLGVQEDENTHQRFVLTDPVAFRCD